MSHKCNLFSKRRESWPNPFSPSLVRARFWLRKRASMSNWRRRSLLSTIEPNGSQEIVGKERERREMFWKREVAEIKSTKSACQNRVCQFDTAAFSIRCWGRLDTFGYFSILLDTRILKKDSFVAKEIFFRKDSLKKPFEKIPLKRFLREICLVALETIFWRNEIIIS